MNKFKQLINKVKAKVKKVIDVIKAKWNSPKTESPSEFINTDDLMDPKLKDIATKLNAQFATLPLEFQRIFSPIRYS